MVFELSLSELTLRELTQPVFGTSERDARSKLTRSLWIFHAQCVPQGGENPFVRTIWFKICTLLQQPVLPVFVFDGPDKPGSKRGKSVSGAFGTSDGHSLQFKQILDNCGLEWWNVSCLLPGYGETIADLARRRGKPKRSLRS